MTFEELVDNMKRLLSDPENRDLYIIEKHMKQAYNLAMEKAARTLEIAEDMHGKKKHFEDIPQSILDLKIK